MFEAEPLHIEAVRQMRALADRIEAAGTCHGFVVGAQIYDTHVRMGGSVTVIRSIAAEVEDEMADATHIHADTDFDSLDAAAV